MLCDYLTQTFLLKQYYPVEICCTTLHAKLLVKKKSNQLSKEKQKKGDVNGGGGILDVLCVSRVSGGVGGIALWESFSGVVEGNGA